MTVGCLTLIPTPLDLALPLESVAKNQLSEALKTNNENTIIVVEEHKEARIRWLSWGLPREKIDSFVLYNEHSESSVIKELITLLKAGKNLFLFSDGGLPGFFDPGQKLINECHKNGLKVTATPFNNSLMLALVLSGFEINQFYCAGFLPAKKEEREVLLAQLLKRDEVIAIMDTPYRLKNLLESLKTVQIKRDIFLALNLNQPSEELHRGSIQSLLSKRSLLESKNEFVLVVNKK